jgi:hypothetical protein
MLILELIDAGTPRRRARLLYNGQAVSGIKLSAGAAEGELRLASRAGQVADDVTGFVREASLEQWTVFEQVRYEMARSITVGATTTDLEPLLTGAGWQLAPLAPGSPAQPPA